MDGVLADLTMTVHFGYLLYVLVGGFLAWRWPRSIVAHLMAIAWGGLALIFRLDCPLTILENDLRRRAGEPGLSHEGFIRTYLTGHLYPEERLGLVRLGAAVVVVLSWVGFVLIVRSRRRAPSPGGVELTPSSTRTCSRCGAGPGSPHDATVIRGGTAERRVASGTAGRQVVPASSPDRHAGTKKGREPCCRYSGSRPLPRAETVGFEPTDGLPRHGLSRAAH